jgi:VanZ family protein
LLAAAFAGLIVYASLHPFAGWQAPKPPGLIGWGLPRPGGLGRFDVVSNFFAYLPLGALIATGCLRDGANRTLAWALGVLVPGALSYGLEQAQHFLPPRVPSVIDWQLNTAGAAAGALLTLAAQAGGALAAWQRWRTRWLLPGQGGGITLLLLWPVALLFPPPLPFGLGQVLSRLHATAMGWLEGTAWAGWLRAGDFMPTLALAPGIERLVILAGLLSPCLLACSITRPGWLRALPLAGVLLLGVGATMLSTALNFGPESALDWITPSVGAALGLVLGLALLSLWLPGRAAAGLGFLVILTGLTFVQAAPADPYHAASLQAWEGGRFIRLHGLAQWIGWLWPYAALAFFLRRFARGEA